MNNIEMKIWGREFNLEVYYQTFSDEVVEEAQIQRFNIFINSLDQIEKSKEDLIDYIKENYSDELSEKNIENIFKYIIPRTIYIPVMENICAILCDFRFDIDNGLAIVFEDGKYKQILTQEDIL